MTSAPFPSPSLFVSPSAPLRHALCLTLAIVLADATHAQDSTDGPSTEDQSTESQSTEDQSTDDVEALGLEMGTPVEDGPPGLGEAYVLEESGDWEIRCISTPLENDPCAMHQLLLDPSGNSVATIELVNLPGGGQAVAGATIVTPLETLLTRQITLTIDGQAGREYPFNFCTVAGCVSRVGFTEQDVAAFRRGTQAELVIFPASAPETEVELAVSLIGFTAGFARTEELNALNAESVAAARAAQEATDGE